MNGAPSFAFNEKLFRAQIPAFAENTVYPTPVVQMYFDAAGTYIANNKSGPLARAGATLLALNLMTAHLMQIGAETAQGMESGVTVSSTVDKVSNTLQQAVLTNQWQLFLASTQYGKQLLALLQVKSVGGFSVTGGGPGRSGFLPARIW